MTPSEGPMAGKICMVTGATSGIGEETARALARMGASVIVVGRSRQKAEATVDQIRRQTGNPAVEFMLADLAEQKEIRRLAQLFTSRHQPLHLLVNNAGALFATRQQSSDGIEMTFALNHLNYFLLTNLLLDTLKASAPSRVVNVAASAHLFARGVNFADLQGLRRYRGWAAYTQSKLCTLLFTYELARRLAGTGVIVNALHPGVVATRFGHNNPGLMGRLIRLSNIIAISPERGARTVVHVATSPALAAVTGRYFVNHREKRSSAASYDRVAAGRLWRLSEEMTGL